MNNRELGTMGEQAAITYLEKRGYEIIAKNFRVGRMGEIDIIGQDGDTLCFIEVKTRSSVLFGTPAQAVSPSKQATIRRLSQIYMQRYRITDEPVRFDVVELMMTRDGIVKNIQIIQNAF